MRTDIETMVAAAEADPEVSCDQDFCAALVEAIRQGHMVYSNGEITMTAAGKAASESLVDKHGLRWLVEPPVGHA
jgi:hypothetical protein